MFLPSVRQAVRWAPSSTAATLEGLSMCWSPLSAAVKGKWSLSCDPSRATCPAGTACPLWLDLLTQGSLRLTRRPRRACSSDSTRCSKGESRREQSSASGVTRRISGSPRRPATSADRVAGNRLLSRTRGEGGLGARLEMGNCWRYEPLRTVLCPQAEEGTYLFE